jgi:hypothetical protein
MDAQLRFTHPSHSTNCHPGLPSSSWDKPCLYLLEFVVAADEVVLVDLRA